MLVWCLAANRKITALKIEEGRPGQCYQNIPKKMFMKKTKKIMKHISKSIKIYLII